MAGIGHRASGVGRGNASERDKQCLCAPVPLAAAWSDSYSYMAKVSFYLLGCVSTIVCRDVLGLHPLPAPPAAVCACVSRLRLGLLLCGASSGARFVVVAVVVLTRSPFRRHDLLDSRVRDSLLAALFAQLRPSTLPVPLCHSALCSRQRQSLVSRVSLARCLRLVYLWLSVYNLFRVHRMSMPMMGV